MIFIKLLPDLQYCKRLQKVLVWTLRTSFGGFVSKNEITWSYRVWYYNQLLKDNGFDHYLPYTLFSCVGLLQPRYSSANPRICPWEATLLP